MKPRRLHFEVLEPRTVLSTIAGESPTDLAAHPTDAKVAFYLEATDAAGERQFSFQTGDVLLLNVFVEDLREEAQGVFAALLDVLFDNNVVVPTGTPEFGSQFPNMHRASCGADGVLDEIGAIGDLTPSGPGPVLVMQIPFIAVAPGNFEFSADPADDVPVNEVLLHGGDFEVPSHQIEYGSTQVEISGLPLAGTIVPCNSAIPKGPVISDSELEEIMNREKEQRAALPPAEPIPEARDDRIFDIVPVDYGMYVLPLSTVGRNLYTMGFLTADNLGSSSYVLGMRRIDIPPLVLDDPLVPDAPIGETGQVDPTAFAEDVQVSRDLPIGTAPVTSISTAKLSVPSSDRELEDLLQDSSLLPLLAGDLDTSL